MSIIRLFIVDINILSIQLESDVAAIGALKLPFSSTCKASIRPLLAFLEDI